VLVSLAALVIAAVVGFLIWANVGVMHAESGPLQSVRDNQAVQISDYGNAIVLSPTGVASGDGLVFIPGAKVAAEAYLYKLSGAVAETGLTVVVTKPILNLAFFDQRPLDSFTDHAPEVDTWFVGGHSLGGVRACQYSEQPDLAGLVLFGSYCANDVSEADIVVLSLSGSEDGLTTPAKITAAQHLVPSDTRFAQIAGANHARFGDYGAQAGDGTASKTSSEVRDIITSELGSILP